MKKQAVLSLSGGMDSTTLLLHLLDKGYKVTAISFDYGQKHRVELERAKQLVQYINEVLFKSSGYRLESWNKWYKNEGIKYQVIKLDGLNNLLVSGLMDNGSMEMKKGHYAHENALTTVVPNRNAIFASIAYGIALSIVKKTNQNCIIALGTHMGDYDNKKQSGIYPDCSEEFKQTLEKAFKIGNWDSEKVDYYTPYNTTDKTGVLKDGINICEKLSLDYKEIYRRTNTSYSPIPVKVYYNELNYNIEWISDFKSGSSIERIESFIKLGLEDPLPYADDDGLLVSWEYVKEYVNKICKEFEFKKI